MAHPEREPPLAGLKVLDFSQNLPGPYATFLLTGWGADVVKLEPPKGDPARFIEPFFSMVNRGKRSVVLDLRDEASRPALEALLRWADVVVEGFRPGVVDDLRCDYETARRLNPRVVYCSISAFGQDGPMRDVAGHDLNLQALAGVCDMERDADGRPGYSMLPIADLSSSLLAVSSICAALSARDRTGEGAYLDVAMADGVLSWANVWGRGVDFAANAEKQLGANPVLSLVARPLRDFLARSKLYAMPHYGVFRCRGGEHLAIGIVDEQHFWRALCTELGLPAFAKLPLPIRIAAGPVLRPLVQRRLARRDREHWLRRFAEVRVPASACLTPEEAVAQPQVRHRAPPDERGWLPSPLPGAVAPPSDAPTKGQHTAEVLGSLGVE